MALKGNNLSQRLKVGNSIPAQSVSTITTINGSDIAEPWRDGRQVAFLFIGGAFAGTASGRLKIQGKKRSDGTYADLVKPGTATVVEFTPTKLDDAGAGENGALLGVLDCADIDGVTYSAIRAVWDNEVAVAQLIAVGHMIYDLYERPSGTTDELFAQMRPVSTP